MRFHYFGQRVGIFGSEHLTKGRNYTSEKKTRIFSQKTSHQIYYWENQMHTDYTESQQNIFRATVDTGSPAYFIIKKTANILV